MDDSILFDAFVVSCSTVGEVLIMILGIFLLLRGANFYGTIHHFIKSPLVALSLVYLLLTLLYVSEGWVEFLAITYTSHKNLNMLGYVYDALLTVNMYWFYTTIVYRVYIAFKYNSEYKLTRFEIVLLSVFIVCQFGLGIFATFLGNSVDRVVYAIIAMGLLFVDIATNLIVLYLFLKRLYLMIFALDESFQTLIVNVEHIRMHTMNRSSDHNDDDAKSESEIRLENNTMQQTEVVNMMAKISLLTIISEMFIDSLLVTQMVLEFNYSDDINSVPFLITHNIMLIICLCVNCFTLYATFVFNDDHYVKCCGFCHTSLKKCCVKCVTTHTLRQRIP